MLSQLQLRIRVELSGFSCKIIFSVFSLFHRISSWLQVTNKKKKKIFEMPNRNNHAVVIGGGIAGLLAGRVLSDFFAQVTIVERDRYPLVGESRRGIPQARHIHVLLAGGLRLLERLYPGIENELVQAGAQRIDWAQDMLWVTVNGSPPAYLSGIESVNCSRDLLEGQIRKRMSNNPRICFLEGSEATSLVSSDDQTVVSGVLIDQRAPGGKMGGREDELLANLVVEASGRTSQVCRWLEELGYTPPEETVVNSFQGYASRWYQPPPGFKEDWKILLLKNSPPVNSRSGGIFIIEGGRWIVTLGGAGCDYPPTGEEEFLEFARSLVSPYLYELIKEAIPLSPIYGFRRTENRLRHFENMSRHPEGLIVLGDAACTFNPIYGQGMSVAALHAVALEACLREYLPKHSDGEFGNSLTGLPRRFHKSLAKANATPWMMATGEDFRFPTTAGDPPGLLVRAIHWYMDHVLELTINDIFVNKAFTEVAHLLKPPASLFQPKVARKVAGRVAKLTIKSIQDRWIV